MPRRLLAAVLALLLAVIAGVLVIGYVSRSDERAMAGMDPTPVIVTTEQIPPGTPAEALPDYLTVEEIPAAAVVPGGIASLADVSGQVTTTTLQPGEQVLAARFAPPEEDEDEDDVAVPEGYHQLSVQLPANRVIGGHLVAGDTVGLFVSSEGETHLRLHKVLVTRVQGGVNVVQDEEGGETTQGPSETLMVTVAVTAPDAELIVNAAEFHAVWLSLEPEDAPEDGTRVVEREDLFP